jgi:hypothetical protein
MPTVLVANAMPSANASSRAEQAPWPMSGAVLWAASPRIATRPFAQVENG